MSTATGRAGFAALDACVHCGFCLQACPTFLATGDEADGPRGRIELMRALERGDLSADDPGLTFHLDRCLACRGCEPVCPSGVGYGQALETARERIAVGRELPWLARAVLWATTAPGVSRVVYALARFLRGTRLPELLAGWGRLGFGMGMLAATRADGRMGGSADRKPGAAPTGHPPIRPSAALLFRGCIMDGLFSHVHEATIHTLEVNGYEVGETAGQACCGALHAHAGLHDAAQAMARINIAAFNGAGPIVVNSAGCGAMLKEYGRLLPDDPGAAAFAARVRDVTELLAEQGPRTGAPLGLRVAYDAPCHLLHAQRVATPPRQVLDAIPGLQWSESADSAQCCGSAGLYSVLQPALSRTVLLAKLERLREDAPDVLVTGNPGCVMQLGAGLRAAGLATTVLHPVELLDASYREAGL